MKKFYLEECIKNVRVLIIGGVPLPVIRFALTSDGVPQNRRETIIRWAKMAIENSKQISFDSILDVEVEQ